MKRPAEAVRTRRPKGGAKEFTGRFIDDEDVQKLMRAIMEDVANPALHRQLGDLHMLQGRFRDAEAEYSNVITLTMDKAYGYILRGRAREEQGKLARAIADYEMALRLHPGNLEARGRLDAAVRKAKGGE